jgi:hypothetical protein
MEPEMVPLLGKGSRRTKWAHSWGG